MLELFFYFICAIFLALFIWGVKTTSSTLLILSAVLMLVTGTTLLTEGLNREIGYQITKNGSITTVETQTTNFPATAPSASDPASVVWIIGNIFFYGAFVVSVLAYFNYSIKKNAKRELQRLGV